MSRSTYVRFNVRAVTAAGAAAFLRVCRSQLPTRIKPCPDREGEIKIGPSSESYANTFECLFQTGCWPNRCRGWSSRHAMDSPSDSDVRAAQRSVSGRPITSPTRLQPAPPQSMPPWTTAVVRRRLRASKMTSFDRSPFGLRLYLQLPEPAPSTSCSGESEMRRIPITTEVKGLLRQ